MVIKRFYTLFISMIQDNAKHYLYRYIRKDNNQVFYIGVGTKRGNRNYLSHRTEYERAYSLNNRNSHFLNIIKKIDYVIEIMLESDSQEFIKDKEKEFISLYGRIDTKKGILSNQTDGGDGHFNMSVENRNKLSLLAKEKFTGKKQNPEHIEKRISYRIGSKMSQETIEKRTETRKQNAINRGYYVNFEKIEKESKPILQFDMDNNFIKEWKSIREACRELNISRSNVINVCKGKHRFKSSGGFIWKYKLSTL